MIRVPDLRRLALIGDSVFAVSITLNARAVTIPRLGTDTWGTPAMTLFLQGIAAVLLSVVVASAFWLGHWRYFRHVRVASVAFIAAHFAFLIPMILLPISTDLYATNQGNPVATFIYGLNLLLFILVALLFRLVAIRHSPGRVVVIYDWIGLAGVALLFTLAVGLSFSSPGASQLCWYIALASPLVETYFSRKIAKDQGLLSAL